MVALGAAPAPQAVPGLKIEPSNVTGLATSVTVSGAAPRDGRSTATSTGTRRVTSRPPETLNQPPATAAALGARAEGPRGVYFRGPLVSVQVNVNASGNNIIGDAANEPSIAVSPADPNRMAIAWRQFDTISSNFRQAGHAYSLDGGQTWTFPGVLDPGQFRSDPVLDSDAAGNFYFSSLSSGTSAEVFKSLDSGVTWLPEVTAFGGDKQWLAVDDRPSGMGAGHVYQHWNVQFSCCPPADFTRSIDGAASFQSPLPIPLPSMKWGSSDVGVDGTLYIAGATLNQDGHLMTRSSNAKDPGATPTFDFVNSVDMGGLTGGFGGPGNPNPAGLLGQVWIAADPSNANRVFMLGSVVPPSGNPVDVMFVRSINRGQSWSAPIRVNDDPASGAFHWFGTIAVAPNGRIDVVWNDTRNTGAGNLSELYYAFSVDGGFTWSGNVSLSPVWDSHLGWPQQNKIGDYYHMISDNGGASLAYAATFNGEQDVYFLRIPADCNNNGVADDQDVAGGATDCNDNEIPDVCEPNADCNGNGTQDICDIFSGFSNDCNLNLVPDSCEDPTDCNGNGQQDFCDLAAGAPDCNGNGVPDSCDIDSGYSSDANGDSIPDECEGACCFPGGACLDTLNATGCAGSRGVYHGDASVCVPSLCPTCPGDTCAVPANIASLPFTAGGNTCACMNEYDETCSGPGSSDAVYVYTPAADECVDISLCNGSAYDTTLIVYANACTTGASYACNDDWCGRSSRIPNLALTGGVTYYIVVDGWGGECGNYVLDITPCGSACPGDTCAVPANIASLPFTAGGNTCACMDDYDEICPYDAAGSADAVYVYTATSSTYVEVTLCANSSYDSKVYVYEDACGSYQSGTAIGCSDDACSTPSFPEPWVSRIPAVSLTAGHTYYFVVDGWGGDCGNYTMDIFETTPPITPTCPDNAIVAQPASTPDQPWQVWTSDSAVGWIVWERFSGATAAFTHAKWWGLEAYYDGMYWFACSEPSPSFQITFYGPGALPGLPVCSYKVVPSRLDTGHDFVPFGLLYQYEHDLSPPCALTSGWISIQGNNGDPNCWFLWGSSLTGDGSTLQSDGVTFFNRAMDRGICLSGPVCGNGIVEPGEACDPPNGVTCNSNCQLIVPPGNIVWDSNDQGSRSLRFDVNPPATATGSGVALKVTMVDLQTPDPDNRQCCPAPNFHAFDMGSPPFCSSCTGEACPADASGQGGCARWVGEPGTFREAQDVPEKGTFIGARLQCTPFYNDWTALGKITVLGAEILPSSRYSVQAYGASCKGSEAGCTKVSAAVEMTTHRSGDVVLPFDLVEPNGLDINEVINKFKGLTTAPKALAKLTENVVDPYIDVGGLDISAVIDAFKSFAYSHSGPCPCPSTVTCGSVACASGQCKTCVSGTNAGKPCSVAGDCPGGACSGTVLTCVKTCVGGDNIGDPCIKDIHCPPGTPGSCGNPFCRDRCGRCN